MYFRFSRAIISFFFFLFSFSLVSQFGKHFFFPFSYLSGIRIDYLAPTIYFNDLLSLPLIIIVIVQLFKRLDFVIRWIRDNKLLIFFIMFFFFINFVFALSQPLWFYGFARLLQFIFLFLFFRHQGNKKGVYAPLLLGLLLGASIELYLSLSQLSQRHSMEGIWYFLGERSFSIFTPGIAKSYFADTQFLRPYGTFSHPNSLGGFYLLIYTVILTQKRITQQIFKRVFLIITSALILISFSRTAIAGYVLINLLYFSRTVFSCKLCSIAKIAVAFVLLLFIFNISGDPNSFQKRADFFGKSLSIIAQKPFSGTGIGSYLIAQHAFPQKFSTFFEQPVHNIFLLIVAQLGIPLSIMLFALIIQKIKHRVQSPALLLPLVCIILTGCVDHYWITLQQNVLVLAVIFGIILTSYEKKTT